MQVKVRKRLQMPRYPDRVSMLETFSLVGKEHLCSSLTLVQQLVLESLTPTSEFIFNAQISLLGEQLSKSIFTLPHRTKIYFESQKPLMR